ncbi:MAG: hypothetical protein AMS26_09850 [Bacteroides sp. SM23_62]|nr:MAG: hypothetical protein AMS26_09850 [Bacteroides sp. SM23_62]
MHSHHSHHIRFLLHALGFLLILALLSSCIKETFDPDSLDTSFRFSPGVAAPIGYFRYQMDELLDTANSTQFSTDDDGFMNLVYRELLESGTASDLIKIQDFEYTTGFENNLDIPIDLSVIPHSFTFSDTLWIPITIGIAGDARIDSVIGATMDLTVDFATHFNLVGEVCVESHNIFDPQGSIFSICRDINDPTSIINLVDYTLRLTDTPADRSLIEVVYTIKLNPSSGIIQPGDPVVDFTVGLSAIEYDVIYGYFGQFSLNLPPVNIPLDLYNPIYEGSFYFEGAELRLIFSNSFGIPVEMTINEFGAIGRNGQFTAITGGNLPASGVPTVLGYPGLLEIGNTKVDSFILTTENSNLFTALETGPSELRLDVDGRVNPLGTEYNFVVDSSKYDVLLELFLPLNGYADNLVVRDTLDFVFNDFYDRPPEEIKRMILRLNITNGFPLNMKVQAYYFDGNDVLLDSLFHDPGDPASYIPAATDNNNDGKVEPLKLAPVEVELSRQQIDNISSSIYMVVYYTLTTPGADQKPPENVQFYMEYFFEVFIGAIAELDVNSTDY